MYENQTGEMAMVCCRNSLWKTMDEVCVGFSWQVYLTCSTELSCFWRQILSSTAKKWRGGVTVEVAPAETASPCHPYMVKLWIVVIQGRFVFILTKILMHAIYLLTVFDYQFVHWKCANVSLPQMRSKICLTFESSVPQIVDSHLESELKWLVWFQ